MEKIRFSISIKDDLKEQLNVICKEKGLKIATLIHLILKKHISLIKKSKGVRN